YYFPFFDKFRTPSMILHVLQILFPILAGFGVMRIISLREEKNSKILKNIKNTALIFSILFVLSILLSGTISDWFVNRVKAYASNLANQQESQMFIALSDYMADMFRGDLQIAMALLSITFGLIYAYLNVKINKQLLLTALAFFILFDLFRIGNRGASYVDAKQIDELFNEPDYVTAIKQQNDKEPFRILNLKQDGSLGSLRNNANYNVYFLLEDFFGYSAVKPRTYQDIVDVVSPVNVTLWRMLNVKYIVTNQPYNPDGFVPVYQSANTFVYKNEKALPRVYFVDSVLAEKPLEILNAIKNDSFDPQNKAYLENVDFKIEPKDTTTNAVITKYQDEHITVETKSNRNNFLFFGTTYLPAWKAYIDGNQIKIYKTNYGFMGIVVPKGNHKVEFIYEPKAFKIGKNLSLILNIILYAGIIAIVVMSRKKNK
ncbi:MAG: YfhO family protein, partial [Melioribacter sp.]|nr:YfhO family protein [Melioribacter sp.]